MPSVYFIATSMEPKHDERDITAHDFVQEHLKVSYCQEASSTVDLQDPYIIMEGVDV